jgi:hypothetical protein
MQFLAAPGEGGRVCWQGARRRCGRWCRGQVDVLVTATWVNMLVSREVPVIWTEASSGMSPAGGTDGAVVMTGK